MLNLSDKIDRLLHSKDIDCLPFFSEREFSSHQLIELLLKHTGPANVRISSFSISEIAMRSLYSLCESGQITSLKCLFDLTVKRHRLGLLFFASNFATEIGLAKNHAKIILIQNHDYSIVVVGSANLNLNDKNEAGIIATGFLIYPFFSLKFNEVFEKSLKISPDEFK